MQFSDVVAQESAKQSLRQMWLQGRMPHALLLLGPAGSGGLALALALAQYVFCSARTDTDSCGHCPGCQKVARLEHADLHLSFPAFGPKVLSTQYVRAFRQFARESPYGSTYEWLQHIGAEQKQGNITAEECRHIIEQLSLKSFEGGPKLQLIWRPEYLDKEGNILLKLIEEPPPDTFLIFVAESTEEILKTILSRTQMLRLLPLTPAEVAQGLQERGLAEGARALHIGQTCAGSFTEALQQAAQGTNDLMPALREWFNALATHKGMSLVRFVNQWSKAGREHIIHLMDYTLRLFEASLRLSYLPETAENLPPQEAEFARRLAARNMPLEAFQEIVAAITEAAYRIERNANTRSVLMALCLQLQRALQARARAPQGQP